MEIIGANYTEYMRLVELRQSRKLTPDEDASADKLVKYLRMNFALLSDAQRANVFVD